MPIGGPKKKTNFSLEEKGELSSYQGVAPTGGVVPTGGLVFSKLQ